ncbi:MAG: hypothetical protein ACOCWC_06120 [Bacteroidota bacterium]
MGIFSTLTCPMPVHAINFGMKPNLKLTIRELAIDGKNEYLSNPYLMVGKGHIRICSMNEDIPPFTLKINSFKEFKMYGVKHYKWTIYNQSSPEPFKSSYVDVGELTVFFENKSVAVWNLEGFSNSMPSLRIVTDRKSFQ